MTAISDSDPEEEREWLDSVVDIDRLGLLTMLCQLDIVEGEIAGVHIVVNTDKVGAVARALTSREDQAPEEAGR